jgi:hypothetical protein
MYLNDEKQNHKKPDLEIQSGKLFSFSVMKAIQQLINKTKATFSLFSTFLTDNTLNEIYIYRFVLFFADTMFISNMLVL